MNEIREQLERVRAGWVKGQPSAPGEACAIYWVPLDATPRPSGAYEPYALSAAAVDVVHQVTKEQCPGFERYFGDVAEWNDAGERTQEEVERVLEIAAIRLEVGE